MGDNTAEVLTDEFDNDTDNDTDSAPAGLVVIQPVEGGYLVNGILATEATHVFRDGKPVLKTDGTPKRKPGRKAGISPQKKPKPVVVVAADAGAVVPPVMAPEPTKVPLLVGTDDAVSARLSEVSNTAAMGIAAISHSDEPLGVTPVPAVEKQAAVEPSPVLRAFQMPTTVTVQKAFGKIGAPEATDETIEVKTFAVQPATVELGYGLTLNIGNYESARVDVRVSVPCYREETDAAFEWAKGWAEARVREEVTSIKKMMVPQKTNPF